MPDEDTGSLFVLLQHPLHLALHPPPHMPPADFAVTMFCDDDECFPVLLGGFGSHKAKFSWCTYLCGYFSWSERVGTNSLGRCGQSGADTLGWIAATLEARISSLGVVFSFIPVILRSRTLTCMLVDTSGTRRS
jgi:hypothetical protein